MLRRKPTLLKLFTALFIASALAACSSPEQKMEKYTKAGETFLNKDDRLRASIQFRNALQIDETHLPALNGLIAIAELDNDYKYMFSLLQQMVRLEPNNVEALVKQGNIYLLASDEAAAQELAEKALAIDSSNLEAKALKASVLFKIGDRNGAIRLAQEVLRDDEANQNALTIIVADMAINNDLPGALREVEAGLAKEPGNTLLSLMQIEILSKLGREDDVDQAFRALIENAPDDPSYPQIFAQNLIKKKRYAEARPYLMSVVELQPDNLNGFLNVVRVDTQLDGEEKAQATFKEFTEQYPKNYDLQFAYVSYLLTQDQEDNARTILNKFAKQKADKPLQNRAKIELAGLAITNKDIPTAEKLINEVIKNDPNNPDALIKQAGLKIDKDDLDSALIDLRNALQNNPDDINALALMSTALEKKGEIDFADKQITQAFDKSEATPRITNAYAQFLIRNLKFDRANQALEQSLSKYPDNIDGLRLLSAARLAQQDWAGAREAALLIEKAAGSDDPAVKRILGTASIGLGQYANAINELTAANQQQPLSSQPLATLVTAYIQENRTDEAKDLLNNIINQKDDNYEERLLLARIFFEEERPSDAEKVLLDALANFPEESATYRLLYEYYLSIDRADEASRVVYGGLETFPDNFDLKVLETDILLRLERMEEALAVYEGLARQKPDHRFVANNYASMLVDLRTDEASLQRAVEFANKIRDVENPYYQDTVGWVYHKAGDNQNALLILRRAVKNAPNVAVLRYHIGAVYLAIGNKVNAKSELEMALKLGGPDYRHAEAIRALLERI